MATYFVKSAVKKKDVEGRHGPMQVISLGLQEYGQERPVMAEWFTKAETVLPAIGSQLEGEVSPGEYGPKFRKTQQGSGMQRGRSPEESRRIVRQHSQTTALRYAEFAHLRGTLPEEFKFADLKKLIDWFHADAMNGGQS